jgi:hypothetical protein
MIIVDNGASAFVLVALIFSIAWIISIWEPWK